MRLGCGWAARLQGMGLAVLIGAAGEAGAVVGGQAESGGLSRSTLMVLNDRGGMCTAVVLAADALVTAAHCLAPGAQHRVHFRNIDGEPVLIEPAERALHPGYDAKAIEARRRSIDLALVRLPSPLPARFAPARLSAAAPGAGEPLTLSGYGMTREGDPRSTGVFRSARLAAIEPYGPSRILVWARDPAARDGAGAGACQGDSGGPVHRDDAVFAVATWSSGPRGRSCGGLSQGVLLGPQREWIDGILKRWGREARWE